MSDSTVIVGLDDVVEKLGFAGEKYREAVEAAVYAQGIALDELVNRKGMVPVDTGALRNSHYVTLPFTVGGKPISEVGYGAEYAPEVHERQNATVSKGGVYKVTSRGTSKWMEKAMNIYARSYLIRMKESIARYFLNGTKAADLTGIVATSPQDSASLTKSQMKWGMTTTQRKRLREAKKKVGINLVRRYKKRRKGKG